MLRSMRATALKFAVSKRRSVSTLLNSESIKLCNKMAPRISLICATLLFVICVTDAAVARGPPETHPGINFIIVVLNLFFLMF